MSISRNHHFIPKFFIKEFSDNNGRVYLYNKKKRKFEENKNTSDIYFKETFKPEKIFCIKDLNNISLLGERNDYIEKYIDKYFDSPSSKFFRYLLKNFDKFLEEEKLIFEISRIGNEHDFNKKLFHEHYNKRLYVSYFIAELFCRNPHNFSLIELYLQTHSPKLDFKFSVNEDSPLELLNYADELTRYFHTNIYDIYPDFKKYDIFLRSLFEIFDIKNINSDWRVLWGSKENNLGMLADMPIVYRDFSKLQNFSELFIPISKDKVIIFGKNLKIKDKKKSGDCDFFQKLSVFAMAEEYIIGSNKKWIETIANFYYKLVDKYGISQVKEYTINQFFDCFEEE